jgi:small subunit ribosomal protein S3
MGQKTNPISNRLGIIRGWDSNWFGGKSYGERIAEDAKIRRYLNLRFENAGLSRIIIERTLKLITVTLSASKPGMIIGYGGQEVDKLKEELKKLTGKDVQINIFEVKRPELDALVVARNIAKQVEGRISYRRAVKMAIANTMRSAQGIKVQISGRLGGAEIARAEILKEGRIPLHTIRANIDYALAEALTKVGLLGIKVWICNGEVYGKQDLSPNSANAGTNFAANPGGFNADRDRRGGGRGGYGGRNSRDNRGGYDRDRKGSGGGAAGGGRDRKGSGSSGGRNDNRSGHDKRSGGGEKKNRENRVQKKP